MLQDLNARPWSLFKHARSLAELQIKIHQTSIAGLPSYKDRLRYDIDQTSRMSDAPRKKVLALLETLPDHPNLCHGDYHPGNVFLTRNGPVVIDWMTACSGSRWADVTRSSMILSIGVKAAGKQVSPLIRMAVSFYHRIYLNHYRALAPDTAGELERWMPVIAAARLNEDIIPEREALIRIVEEGLAE